MNKNVKVDPFKTLTLDPEEKWIEDHAEEFVPVPKTNPIYGKLMVAAKNYKKDTSISLRINKQVLESLKQKAEKAGLPYQTVINALIHQYADGQIRLSI